jgi:hypothetical protein
LPAEVTCHNTSAPGRVSDRHRQRHARIERHDVTGGPRRQVRVEPIGVAGTEAPLQEVVEELRGRLEHAVEELDRVIRDLRNYIFGLRPGILADRRLDQALAGPLPPGGQNAYGGLTTAHRRP